MIFAPMSLIRSVFIKCINTFTGGPAPETLPTAGLPDGASSFHPAENTEQAICKRLQAIARGESHQVLPAMDAISRGHDMDESVVLERIKEISRARPYEAGHLMTRLFSRATTETRLAILNEFVISPKLGDKHTVGDLFVTLMERSTREERRSEIYPGLYRMIDAARGAGREVQGKRAFLIALLKGWMSEI